MDCGRWRRILHCAHRHVDVFEVAVSHLIREKANTSCWLDHGATVSGLGSPRNATRLDAADNHAPSSPLPQLSVATKTCPLAASESILEMNAERGQSSGLAVWGTPAEPAFGDSPVRWRKPVVRIRTTRPTALRALHGPRRRAATPRRPVHRSRRTSIGAFDALRARSAQTAEGRGCEDPGDSRSRRTRPMRHDRSAKATSSTGDGMRFGGVRPDVR